MDDRESIQAVRKALDLEINFFDTADVYGLGHSEQVLCTALGEARKRVIVATKFGLRWDERGNITRDCSPSRVVEALEGSLRRLQIDCIPLY
jgi:aryl-alcohol dehydrogenase-like predicted oxidoreductase